MIRVRIIELMVLDLGLVQARGRSTCPEDPCKDGRRETTELPGHTMSDARELAKWVLNHWNGVYAEIDICADDKTVETVRNPNAPSPVGTD